MSRLVTSSIDAVVPELRLEARLRDLEQRLVAKEANEDYWHVVGAAGEVAFSANWQPYPGGTPTTYFSPAFRRLNGIVYLRGMIEKTIAVVGSEAMFNLPVGYRPTSKAHLFLTISNNALARIDILSNGNVTVPVGNAAWISLDGISFPLE